MITYDVGKISSLMILSFQLVIKTKSGELVDRLSPWASYVTQPDDTKAYDQVFWSPPQVIYLLIAFLRIINWNNQMVFLFISIHLGLLHIRFITLFNDVKEWFEIILSSQKTFSYAFFLCVEIQFCYIFMTGGKIWSSNVKLY